MHSVKKGHLPTFHTRQLVMRSNRHYLQILGIAFMAETHTLSCRHQYRQQHNAFNNHSTNNDKNTNFIIL